MFFLGFLYFRCFNCCGNEEAALTWVELSGAVKMQGKKNQFILWLAIYFMVGEMSFYVMIMLPSMRCTVSVSNINNCCIWVACVVLMWSCGMALRLYCIGHITHQFRLSCWSKCQYLTSSLQMNVSKAHTWQVCCRTFHRGDIWNGHVGVSTESLKALLESHLEGLTFSLSKIIWMKQVKKTTKWLLYKEMLWRFLMLGVSLCHLKIFLQYRCELLMPSWEQMGNLLCLVAHLGCERLYHCLH